MTHYAKDYKFKFSWCYWYQSPLETPTEPHTEHISNNSLSMRTDLITFIVFSILAHLDGIRNYVIFRSKVQCVTRFDRRILWNILTFYTATTTLIISVVKSFLLAYFFRKYFLLCSVQWEHYFVVKYLYIVCTIYRATRKGLPVIQVI